MRTALAIAILVPALALTIVPAAAQPPSDSIGIFFDQQGTSHCSFSPALYANVTAYLLALNVSDPSGIVAWNARVVLSPAGTVANYSWPFAVIPETTPPDFGLTLPPGVFYPPAAAIPLMTIQVFYLGGSVDLAVGPIPTASPGLAYATVAAPQAPRLLHPVSDFELPGQPGMMVVAGIGTASITCNVDLATPSSWGAIKALYE